MSTASSAASPAADGSQPAPSAADGSETARQSPIHDRHEAAGAKFSEFGGWSMPREYAGAGVLAEHNAVRAAVGLFDVSHLGKIGVTGPGAADFVNRCLTADLRKIAPGQAQYTLICNDDGGVVDDLIAYLNGPDDVFLIPNAANCAEVAGLLTATAPGEIAVADQHDAYAVFAVQGPHSDEVLEVAGLPTGHGYMSFARAALGGVPLTVCRTGYTGERGYELVMPSEGSAVVWDAVVAAGEPYGLQLAGLAARDTLRTEMGYPLHGQDISPDISPVQARLGWAVGWKKDSFFGDAALRAEKEATPNRLLWGLKAVGRGIPRPGMLVRDADGHEIGSITSGTYSPTLRTGIALALLDSRFAVEEQVQVDVRQRREAFTIIKPPFVTPDVREP